MSIERLQQQAAELEQSINADGSVATIPPSENTRLPIFSTLESRVLKAYADFETLQSLKEDLEIQKAAQSQGNDGGTEQDIMRRIDTLKKELRISSGNETIKDQAVDSVNHSTVVLKALYGNTDDDQDRLLLDLLKERDALSGQFLRHHAEVLRLNDEHADLQKQVLARQAENRTLMAEIKSMEGDNKPDEHGLSQGQAEQLSIVKEQFRESKQKREIVRNVLMGLILESGVAWTEDRDMLNLMFTLGDTPVPAAM